MSKRTGQAAHGPPGFDPGQCRSLYVGNLHPNITDALLYEIFATFGQIEGCKLIKDKNATSTAGYGFVDYVDHDTANVALSALNGRTVYGYELKVNWAFAGGHREDTSSHYHIFVGDLSPDVDDKALYNAFSAFGTISDARVMWDQNTGRSRGYGFVAFRVKEDAERALGEMNGEWLGNRAIRCNWANQKNNTGTSEPGGSLELSSIMSQTTPGNTTVYIGNLVPDISDASIRQHFSDYGQIEEIRVQKDKGFAFVRYRSHEEAGKAIVGVHGRNIQGKNVKCSWGKERSAGSSSTPETPPVPNPLSLYGMAATAALAYPGLAAAAFPGVNGAASPLPSSSQATPFPPAAAPLYAPNPFMPVPMPIAPLPVAGMPGAAPIPGQPLPYGAAPYGMYGQYPGAPGMYPGAMPPAPAGMPAPSPNPYGGGAVYPPAPAPPNSYQ